MHRFEEQRSTLALAEGLAEYYAKNPHLPRLRSMSPEGAEFFRCHDTAHVVYGCNTSLKHEAIVKLASIFGTTAGFAVLRGYRLHESVSIYKQLKAGEALAVLLVAPVLIPRTIYRCLRQHKRWPWADFAQYQQTPLAQIRAEFGIAVPGSRNASDA